MRGAITFVGKAWLSEYYIFDGKVSVHSPSWTQTLAWICDKQLWGAHGLQTPIVWESRFLAQPMHIEMNNVAFTMGIAKARGTLKVDFQSHVPAIMGSLVFDDLDLNFLRAVFFFANEKKIFFDRTIFDYIEVDVRLSVPQAKIGNFELKDLAAAIQIRDGHGILDLGHAHVFDGSLQSNIQIAQVGHKMCIEGQISGTSIDTKAALEALKIIPFVQSKVDFTMTIQTLASSWSEIFKKMQGEVALNMSFG